MKDKLQKGTQRLVAELRKPNNQRILTAAVVAVLFLSGLTAVLGHASAPGKPAQVKSTSIVVATPTPKKDTKPTTPPPAKPKATAPAAVSSGPVNCALNTAAKSCWAANTGVPKAGGGRWTEAEIVAGQSPLVHTVGDRKVTVAGTVIDNQWIDGCVAIYANNVTIKNSFIRTMSDCGGLRGAISGPNSSIGRNYTGLVIQDTEVDAGNTVDGYDYTGITATDYSLLRVNVHGATHTIWTGANVNVTDSFIHDPSTITVTNHNEAIDGDSGNHVVLNHNWVSSWNGNNTQAVTGAAFIGGSWGPPSYYTITNNFFEGGRGTDLVLDDRMTFTVVTGNRLSPHTAWGNQYTYQFKATNTGNVWSDNRDSESGAVVNP